MSELDQLIEGAKQGDLERVRAILGSDDELAKQRDKSGATPQHYAALNGHRQVARPLLERCADIESADSQFGATPTGWAIELDDLSYAIEIEGARWVARLLKRFPSLRKGSATKGTLFETLARESGNREIAGRARQIPVEARTELANAVNITQMFGRR